MGSRLSLNQGTIKHASLIDALDATTRAGIEAIGLWREPVAELGLDEASRRLAGSGLRMSSLCRGGFVTVTEGPARRAAIDDNRRAIDETAALAAAGASGSRAVLVLVPGGLAAEDRDIVGARKRVREAVEELEPFARDAGVTLAVEPFHPMYAADRSVISTLGQALDLVDGLPSESAGVAIDTFHVWWDPDVYAQIVRAGSAGRIASYQVGDWVVPLAADTLLSRGMVGDGHVDFAGLTRAVEDAGYTGDIEVEVFSASTWEGVPAAVASLARERFDAFVAPFLR